jgi:hypothetical protein
MTKSSAAAKNSNLLVKVYWGDVLYDVALLGADQAITIGHEPQNSYVLDFGGIERRPSFELVRVGRDGAELHFDDTIKGHVKIKNNMVSLASARNSSMVPKDERGIYNYRLEKNDTADMVVDLVSFYFAWADDAEIISRAPLFRNRRFVPLFFILTALLMAAIWYLAGQAPPEEEKPPERVVTLISKAQFAKAAIGERKSATGGAQKGPLGKAELHQNAAAKSQPPKFKSASLGNLVSSLTSIAKDAPNIKNGDTAKQSASIDQAGTGGFSTEGLKQGGGGKTSGLGRTVGQGEGGFEGTGRLGLSGNAAHEGGTGYGQDLKGSKETGLDRDVIDAIIRRRQDRIRLCYERQLNFNPKLSGKVALHFVIGAAGQVTSKRITEDTMKSQNVNSCILSEIATWTFPAPRGAVNVDVDYPFFFESSNKK